MLQFATERFNVPQPSTAICVQNVQMDITRTFFVRNVGVNELRIHPEESANGSTYSAIPGLERTLAPGAASMIPVESSYPFLRLVGNGNTTVEVGTVGSFQGAVPFGSGLLLSAQ